MTNLDLMLGIIRFVILVTIVIFLWKSGSGKVTHAQLGWRCILGGFSLMIMSELYFIIDEYLPFHSVIPQNLGINDHILGTTIGYVGGFLLLGLGLLKWVPDIKRLATETSERMQSEKELMRTYDNIRILLRDQTAELQMAVSGLEAEIKEREAAEAELSRHKANLEELVASRTEQVHKQAKQLEEALEQEKEYSARQREFVSLVSHEFRTPLTIIDGSAQRMMRRKDKLTPDEVVTRGLKIREAVQRITGLIETTLYASRMDADKIEINPNACDIKRIITDVCARQTEISPSYNITADIGSLPDEILADRNLIDQVVANLISNAVKYSPASADIHVHGWTDGDNALVSVRDNGIGIPEEDLPRVFDRYFRARTSEGIPGTGISLNIVKKMINIHKGKIWGESVEGEGSTFTFSTPTHAKNVTNHNNLDRILEGSGI